MRIVCNELLSSWKRDDGIKMTSAYIFLGQFSGIAKVEDEGIQTNNASNQAANASDNYLDKTVF